MAASADLPIQAPASELKDRDRKYVIHPHQRADRDERHIIVRGKGSTVWDAEGNEYLDAMGSANWMGQVGHARPELAEAAAEQMAELQYFTGFDVYSNEPSIRLAERLAGLAPEGIDRVFFTNGGSEGVDSAFKAARLFHFRRGEPDRTWIISRRLAYHGCTYGSGTASGFDLVQHGFGPNLPNVEKVTPPLPFHSELYGGQHPTDFLVNELEQTIERIGAGNIAAMIGEPVMGGAGVVPPPDDYWPRIREVLSAHGILLIADEVVTSYGRTGVWFESQRRGMNADIIVTSKGLTSGYMPLGAVLIRNGIADAITEAEGFFHGHTYFGHPVACAVAMANLDVLEREGLLDRAKQIGEWFEADLAPAREFPTVGEVRVAGATAGIELVADRQSREPLLAGAAAVSAELRRAHHVIVRDYNATVVLAPPLVLERSQARQISEAIVEVVSRLRGDGTLSPR
ncbi:putrescine aminotransferase [Saccharopolyspora antimicrobica]|uniref:Putrescine aminotransferase n=2 Tax=Saccharopolyspora antimicrobica TaxID=455193 RepID=A0A1I4VUG1_9PSEU|nr:putrescine aminotransferase [Saccharopolyspora antimicrobica]SFN04636.1 putrescine aminotransferase [Saccharopolyspora antimicrobica]